MRPAALAMPVACPSKRSPQRRAELRPSRPPRCLTDAPGAPRVRARYTMASLMAAKHDYELKADAHTHVHLDHRHMGVGGDDSWSPSLHKARARSGARAAGVRAAMRRGHVCEQPRLYSYKLTGCWPSVDACMAWLG